MKTVFFKSAILLIFISSLFSCEKPPEYDVIPELNFENITLFNNEIGIQDSVVIELSFKDGDADLGLEDADSLPPFHDFDILSGIDGNPITPADLNNVNQFSFSQALDLDADGFDDYVKIKRNPFRNNYLVTFMKENSSGVWEEISDSLMVVKYESDLFHGRFERLNKKDFSNDIYVGPLEGTIKFTMKSIGFKKIGNKLKFRIFVYDREKHQSNTVETDVIEFI